MDVGMASRFRQLLSRHISESPVVGNSMLVRLRSGMIGLVALAAAVGLGLVALISHQGWPDVSSGPLPPRPATPFVRHETIALPGPSTSPAARVPSARRPAVVPAPAPAPSVADVPPPAEPKSTGTSPASELPPGNPPVRHPPIPQPSHPATSETPPPAPPSAPPATTVTTAAPEPESPPTEPSAVASQVEESSPGHSGEPHGNAPPWAGHGNDSSSGHGPVHGEFHSHAPTALPSYTPPSVGTPSDDDSDVHGHDAGHWHNH
jgi:hypothetical protein